MASVGGIRYRPRATPTTDNPSVTGAFDSRFPVQTVVSYYLRIFISSYLIILILIVTTLIVTTLIVTTYLPKTTGQFALLEKTSGSYELFRLVLIWGPSFCQVQRCNRTPTAPNFTLHGLWPDNRTETLCDCSSSPYTPLQDQSDINQRVEYWFDYKLERTPNVRRPKEQGFWRHEWEKHGTCSEMNFRQAEYFNLAVALTRRYNIRIKEEILSRVVFPNRSSVVLNAIKNVTNNKLPEVRRARKRQLLLNEVVICFDPMGTDLVDCPATDAGRSCSTNLIEMPKTF